MTGNYVPDFFKNDLRIFLAYTNGLKEMNGIRTTK